MWSKGFEVSFITIIWCISSVYKNIMLFVSTIRRELKYNFHEIWVYVCCLIKLNKPNLIPYINQLSPEIYKKLPDYLVQVYPSAPEITEPTKICRLKFESILHIRHFVWSVKRISSTNFVLDVTHELSANWCKSWQ